MKKTLIFVLSTVFAFSFMMSCKKKEEKKAAVDNSMAADMAEPMKEEPMKEEPKPAEPKAEEVTPPTMTQIAEIGVPKVAVYFNFAKMAESPLLKDTGLIDKMNVSFVSDSKNKDEMEKLGKCLGIELKSPVNVLSKVVVFSDGTESNIIAIMELPVEAEKMMGCVKETAKDSKVEDATIGGAKGYKVTDKEKKVSHVVAIDKNKVLLFTGEQKEFVAKLKVGEGNIGKGDVEGYFPGGPQCLKVIVRELDVEKFAKGAGGMLPNLKTLDLDAMVGVANGLKVDVKADTKDAKAAESISAMMTVAKANPQAKAQLKAMGLDENLMDKIVIKAEGSVVTVKIDLDMDTVKGIVEKVKGMVPGAPAAPAPAADDMKADDMKAEPAMK